MKQRGKKLLSLLLAAEMLAGSVFAGGAAMAAEGPIAGTPYTAAGTYDVTVPHVIINQIYGGGRELDDEIVVSNGFVELYNPTNIEVSLNGWSLQYADNGIPGTTDKSDTAGGVTGDWEVLNLTGAIPAHSSYLIKAKNTGSAEAKLDITDKQDLMFDHFLNNKGMKVALMSDNTPLTAKNPFEAKPSGYVDMVGTGSNDSNSQIDGYEMEHPSGDAGGTSKKIALRRINFTDSDHNNIDFEQVNYDKVNEATITAKGPRSSADNAWGISPLVFTALSLPEANAGSPYTAYSVTTAVYGGTIPYHYAADGLPSGLSINPSNGSITGTPGEAGTASVTIKVTDSAESPLTIEKELPLMVNAAPAPAIEDKLSVEKIGEYQVGESNEDGGVAEIVKYNKDNGKMYVVNGSSTPPSLDIVALTNDEELTKEKSVLVKNLSEVDGFEYGDLTSVDVNTATKRVAVAIQEADSMKPGKILVLDYDGNLLTSYPAGVQPDMVKYTTNGKYLMTADEAEPRNAPDDPNGSVTIVDTTTGVSTQVAFDKPDVIDDNVHIRGESGPGGLITGSGTKEDAIFDLEPEYIALSADETKAYVSLQEGNAIATIDIAGKTVDSIKGLGLKDLNDPKNSLDLVEDGEINLENVPFSGMYMPDGIATYSANGKQYLFTANEGDATEWPVDADELTRTNATKIEDIKDGLNPDSAAAKFLDGEDKYDDVEVVSDMGNDGVYLYGGRSFSIWDTTNMTQVFDSGSDFEKITGQRVPDNFNASNSKTDMDDRSPKKGPEPEYVSVGQVGSKAFAFVGLERVGGIMTYDVTDPTKPAFANYINTRDFSKGIETDAGPEGLEFIPATESPTDLPLLLVANEVGGTVAVLQLNVTKVTLDKSELALAPGGEGAKLTAAVTPVGDSAPTVTWTSSNSSIAEVDANGFVKPGSKEGTVVITALSADGYGVAEATVTVSDGFWNLTVMHTNDTHAHLADVARRATLVNQVRSEGGDSLLFDAGDVFSGDLYFTKWFGQADLSFMNYMGYDAMTFGNHEFDAGTDTLKDFVSKANFPLLTSNIDFSKDANISPLLKAPATIDASAKKSTDNAGVYPYIILNVSGHKVGVFGLTTEDTKETSSPGKDVVFNDATKPARNTVAALKEQGIDVIFALSHLGYNRDRDLAQAVEGIDLIVGGHTHTLLDKPVVVQGDDAAPTVIVQANEWGKFLGRVDLAFDDQGVVMTGENLLKGGLMTVDATVTEDEAAKNMLAPYNADLEELKKQVIGKTTVVLNGERNDVRAKETNLGNFIADGMLARAKELKNADVAIMNGGGIRTSIKLGDITMGDLRTVMPFGNTLYVLDVTGQELKDGLENGVSGAKLGDLPGKFPQVAGMRFKWDPNQAAGSKVFDLQIKTESGYTAVDLTKTYRLATNSFVALGGDGYASFAKAIEEGAYHEDLGYPDYEIFIQYMTSLGGTISPVVDGRITEQAKPTEGNGGYYPPPTPPVTEEPDQEPAAGTTELPKAALQVTKGTNEAGQALNQVTVKAEDLQAALAAAFTAAGTGKQAELVINMQDLSGATEITLPAEALNVGADKAGQMTIRIETGAAAYNLPLNVLKLSEAGALGNVSVRVSIAPVSDAALAALTSKANSMGAQLVNSTSLEFEVVLVTGNEEEERNDFGTTYVSRIIYLPASTDLNGGTAVMVDPVSGELVFVPNVGTTLNGKPAVEMKRPGNSTYTVIKYSKSFADLNGHWAKNEIEDMASKLIVKGMDDTHFAPNNAITRAEFTSLLVRSLGLTMGKGSASFEDVASDAWYAGATEAAVEAGLVNGMEPGKFAPTANITRAEMAVMIARAMEMVDKANAAGNAASLSKFTDGASIPDWASAQAALLADKGIMQGDTKGAFAPANKATRAEAALILERTLKELNFID